MACILTSAGIYGSLREVLPTSDDQAEVLHLVGFITGQLEFGVRVDATKLWSWLVDHGIKTAVLHCTTNFIIVIELETCL